MAKHRCNSTEFRRQVAQALIAGEILHNLPEDYEAKIAPLERMVGRQALEIEFLDCSSSPRQSPIFGTD